MTPDGGEEPARLTQDLGPVAMAFQACAEFLHDCRMVELLLR
jgi:hypothetical protein